MVQQIAEKFNLLFICQHQSATYDFPTNIFDHKIYLQFPWIFVRKDLPLYCHSLISSKSQLHLIAVAEITGGQLPPPPQFNMTLKFYVMTQKFSFLGA